MKSIVVIIRMCFLTFSAIWLLAGASSASDDFFTEVRGVRIVDVGYRNHNEILMPFNQFAGTSISCLLLSKKQGIINFVDVKSVLTEFKDNLGTNLLDSSANFGNGIGLMHQISQDRSALLFELTGGRVPDKKATSLVAVGEVVVETANKSKVITLEKISLKEGSVIEAPFGKIEIIGIGETNWGEHPKSISFESSVNLSVMQSVKFTDLTGAPIDSESMGMGSLNEVGDLSTLIYKESYSIARIPSEVNMEITYWEDMQARVIPFSIHTSVGL